MRNPWWVARMRAACHLPLPLFLMPHCHSNSNNIIIIKHSSTPTQVTTAVAAKAVVQYAPIGPFLHPFLVLLRLPRISLTAVRLPSTILPKRSYQPVLRNRPPPFGTISFRLLVPMLRFIAPTNDAWPHWRVPPPRAPVIRVSPSPWSFP